MKIAILGFADQGKSAYEYWNTDGNELTICDLNTDIEVPSGGASHLGEDYLQNLDQYDLLVRTPSLHPREIVRANSESILSKITTVTDEFLRVCPTRNVIGITGTKGKGTTSTLVAKILEATGLRVHLGGNIGIPPLELLKRNIQPDDWVVLELANFQLIDIKHSPALAVCLMVEPEHMDWHTDMDEYTAAKQQLFRWQTPKNRAIYYEPDQNSKFIVSISAGIKIPYFAKPGAIVESGDIRINEQTICNTSELQLLGEHNWQNICAAVTAVWQITQDVNAIRSVVTSFTGLEHRLQLVREFQGVKYYDDSFGTTPGTAIVALKAIKEPKVVILGGSDKGATYDELAKTVVENNVQAVIVIGATGPAIAEALHAAGFINVIEGGNTMPEILAAANQAAQSGNVILLSTGCASFGLFKNYKDRGEQFTAAVQALS